MPCTRMGPNQRHQFEILQQVKNLRALPACKPAAAGDGTLQILLQSLQGFGYEDAGKLGVEPHSSLSPLTAGNRQLRCPIRRDHQALAADRYLSGSPQVSLLNLEAPWVHISPPQQGYSTCRPSGKGSAQEMQLGEQSPREHSTSQPQRVGGLQGSCLESWDRQGLNLTWKPG